MTTSGSQSTTSGRSFYIIRTVNDSLRTPGDIVRTVTDIVRTAIDSVRSLC
jgi:hypothetical protein